MLEQMPDSPKKRPFEKELEFHDQRWAKKETDRGFLSRKTKEDFMREEALLDDEDFEKKFKRESKEEYDAWETHAKPVREAFLEQSRNPEGVDFVTVAAFLPGGMRAAGIAGAALALNEMGIKVNYAVGSSSGDTVATRLVGGREQLLRGIAMLTGPLADKKFIDVLRPGNTIDINYIKELEDHGEYALDQEAIKNSHSKLWTIVTEPMNGNEEPRVKIIEKVKAENPGKKVKMLIFTQASFEALEDIKPAPLEITAGKIMRGVAGPLQGMGSLGTAATVRQLAKGLVLKENLRKTLQAIEEETGADIGVEWAPVSSLSITSIDGNEMKMASDQSFREIIKRFGMQQPDEIPTYVPKKDEFRQAA